MSNRPKIHATNAINSIRQYRCTNAGVSNYIKISTVVDRSKLIAVNLFQTTFKFLLLVDTSPIGDMEMFQTTLKFLLHVDIAHIIKFNMFQTTLKFLL